MCWWPTSSQDEFSRGYMPWGVATKAARRAFTRSAHPHLRLHGSWTPLNQKPRLRGRSTPGLACLCSRRWAKKWCALGRGKASGFPSACPDRSSPRQKSMVPVLRAKRPRHAAAANRCRFLKERSRAAWCWRLCEVAMPRWLIRRQRSLHEACSFQHLGPSECLSAWCKPVHAARARDVQQEDSSGLTLGQT